METGCPVCCYAPASPKIPWRVQQSWGGCGSTAPAPPLATSLPAVGWNTAPPRCRRCPQRCWLTLAKCSAARAPLQQRSFECPQPSSCAPCRCASDHSWGGGGGGGSSRWPCSSQLLTVAMQQPAALSAEHSAGATATWPLAPAGFGPYIICRLDSLLMAAPAGPVKGRPVFGPWVPCNLGMLCGHDGEWTVMPLLPALQRPAPCPGCGTAASSATACQHCLPPVAVSE